MSHNRVHILSCKHTFRPMRVHVVSRLFYKIIIAVVLCKKTTGFCQGGSNYMYHVHDVNDYDGVTDRYLLKSLLNYLLSGSCS